MNTNNEISNVIHSIDQSTLREIGEIEPNAQKQQSYYSQ